MPKENALKNSADLLSDAFPLLLKALSMVSDAIPAPAGPIIKVVVDMSVKQKMYVVNSSCGG